ALSSWELSTWYYRTESESRAPLPGCVSNCSSRITPIDTNFSNVMRGLRGPPLGADSLGTASRGPLRWCFRGCAVYKESERTEAGGPSCHIGEICFDPCNP